MTDTTARSWYDAQGRYNIAVPITIKASELTTQDREDVAKLYAEVARLRTLKKRDEVQP